MKKILLFSMACTTTLIVYSDAVKTLNEERALAKIKALKAAAQAYKIQLNKVTSHMVDIMQHLIQEHLDTTHTLLQNTAITKESTLLSAVTKEFALIHTKMSAYMQATYPIITHNDIKDIGHATQQLLEQFFRTVARAKPYIAHNHYAYFEAWCTEYSGKMDDLFNHLFT
jgi:hypothetical protein